MLKSSTKYRVVRLTSQRGGPRVARRPAEKPFFSRDERGGPSRREAIFFSRRAWRAMSRLSRVEATQIMAWLSQRHRIDLGRIALCDARVAGTGLKSTAAAAHGDVLLKLPRAVWYPFSAAVARETLPSSVITSIEAQATSVGGSGSQLADAVLLASTIAQQAATSPEHAPYLSQLPPPDVPLLWPAPLRKALLQGSSADGASQQQTALSDAFYATLSSAITNAPERGAFKWAQSLLLSRAHSGAGKPLALVPGMDLLNHGGATASADVAFDEATSSFLLVARRGLVADEEITIDYGTDASHRLLRLYGFVVGSVAAAVADADAARVGEEVLLSLVPPYAELGAIPEVERQAWQEHRAALAACGLRGSMLRLIVDPGGGVTIPQLTQGGAASETALLVLAAAIDGQLQRQADGMSAAAAVQAAEAAPAEFRQRARLAFTMHSRERAVLIAAEHEIQRRLRAIGD